MRGHIDFCWHQCPTSIIAIRRYGAALCETLCSYCAYCGEYIGSQHEGSHRFRWHTLRHPSSRFDDTEQPYVKLYVPIVPIVVNTTEVSVHHPDPHDLEQPYVKLYVPIVPIVVNTTSSGFGKQIPLNTHNSPFSPFIL